MEINKIDDENILGKPGRCPGGVQRAQTTTVLLLLLLLLAAPLPFSSPILLCNKGQKVPSSSIHGAVDLSQPPPLGTHLLPYAQQWPPHVLRFHAPVCHLAHLDLANLIAAEVGTRLAYCPPASPCISQRQHTSIGESVDCSPR